MRRAEAGPTPLILRKASNPYCIPPLFWSPFLTGPPFLRFHCAPLCITLKCLLPANAYALQATKPAITQFRDFQSWSTVTPSDDDSRR
jgi:hypothetical protein